jgi:nucleoside-diphosphate-sugar epimerase
MKHNNSTQKSVLITGAGGILGQQLIAQLIDIGRYQMIAVTSQADYYSKQFHKNKLIRFYNSGNLEGSRLPFHETDVVIHCAFARTNSEPELADSLHFAQQVFAEAFDNNCHVINISSRSVYGQNPNTPWNETTPVEPDSYYALAKFNCELLLQASFRSNLNVFHTNIRLAGLVGPNLDARMVNKFITRSLTGEPLMIKGGNQQFAYLDVRDAASGIIALLNKNPQNWKPIYNLGYIRSYTIKEIAETVAVVAPRFNCPEVRIDFEKTNEMLYAELDSTLFYSDTGWQPQYDMVAIAENIFRSMI